MKRPLRIALVLLALVLLLGVGVLLFLDSIVRGAVEKGGTYATGTPVDLSSADLSLRSGTLDLERLTVANPEGFRAEPFLAVGKAHAAWQNGTIFSDELVIEELSLDGIDVHLERANGRTNFGQILDHVKSRGGKDGGKEPADTGAKKTLVVKRILLTNVGATVHLDGVPLAGGAVAVNVPRIEVDDFRSDGSTREIVAKLTGAIIEAVLDEAVKVGGTLPKEILDDLKGGLSDLKKQAEDALEEAKKGLDDVKDIFKKK